MASKITSTLLAPACAIAFVAASPVAAQSGDQAPAETPTLSIEQQGALRCSAAFAVVTHGQDNGDEAALQFAPIGERGETFFMRTMAKLMDETELNREEVAGLVFAEAQNLQGPNQLEAIMPACLLMLDASGI